MTELKIYNSVIPHEENISFNIKRMEDIWSQRKGQADEPHRHGYYTIVLPLDAKGQHIIDFHEFPLQGSEVYFVSPGQVHQIIEEKQSIGYALTFSRQFLAENQIDACFIDDLHLFQDFGFTPPLTLTSDQKDSLSQHCEQMLQCLETSGKFTYNYIGALLKIFLIECNRICDQQDTQHSQEQQGNVTVLREFKALLNEHYRNRHKVKEYAELMHITPDHLNTLLKKYTGKTAKDHIQSKILVEAKRMLKFSELAQKEIAYQLGFSESANFSQFFKKNTGLSPSQFVS